MCCDSPEADSSGGVVGRRAVGDLRDNLRPRLVGCRGRASRVAM